MVNVGTGTAGTRFISRRYPVTEGLTAGTNKLPKRPHLRATKGSFIPRREKVGL